MAHRHKSYVKSHWLTSWFSRWVYIFIYNGISIHLLLSIPASAREQICRWMEGCCFVCHRVIGFIIAFLFCRSFNIWFERTREGESSLKWASDTWGFHHSSFWVTDKCSLIRLTISFIFGLRSGRSSFYQAHTKSTAWSQQSIFRKKASTLRGV